MFRPWDRCHEAGCAGAGILGRLADCAADTGDRKGPETGRCRSADRGWRSSRTPGKIAGVDVGCKIDAELLQELALHFGDDNTQHHLLLAFDGEQVDDLLLIALVELGCGRNDEAGGDLAAFPSRACARCR